MSANDGTADTKSQYDDAVGLPIAVAPPEPTRLDVRAFLDEEVNTDIASIPLALYNFMTVSNVYGAPSEGVLMCAKFRAT